jgi:hypothetical protein
MNMRWRILCVNLAKPQYPDIILDVSLQIILKAGLTFKAVESVKQITICHVGGSHPIS